MRFPPAQRVKKSPQASKIIRRTSQKSYGSILLVSNPADRPRFPLTLLQLKMYSWRQSDHIQNKRDKIDT